MKADAPFGQPGYYFPAEWRKHRSTWLSWPHNQETWPGGINSIFDGYLQFVKEISIHELVSINVADEKMEREVRKMLGKKGVDLSQVVFYHHPTNDAWCRDHGPCFVTDSMGKKVIVNWGYNAWGEKYPPYELDNNIPRRVASSLGLELVAPGLVLEGGSIDCNGQGTLLTTTQCLLNPNRNSEITREVLEMNLMHYFGVKQVVWLEDGIAGDDTDGHIDTISRFINPSTIVTVMEDDPAEINYLPLRRNYELLKDTKLYNGAQVEIVILPMPDVRYNQGQRLPASYANFYICNGAVLVPTYNDPNDQRAISILQEQFQDRQVIGINCLEIIRGLGGLHCLCMQEPCSVPGDDLI